MEKKLYEILEMEVAAFENVDVLQSVHQVPDPDVNGMGGVACTT